MIRWPRYRAHKQFVAPAIPTAALWRLLAGLVLAVIGYVALGRMFFQFLYGLTQQTNPSFVDEVLDGLTPGAMLVMLFSFAFMTMAVVVVVRLIHHRSAFSLFGPLPMAFRQFRAVIVSLAALGVVIFVLPPWDMGGAITPNLRVGPWLALLPLSLLAVFVQISAEEIFFRGYIQQQLAARFASPLIWMVLPSALFALGHYLPGDAGENALMIALWAGIFGILMADITARAGSLGPAIALHFYNNVTAILIVSLPDDLSGLALYHAPFGLEDAEAIRAWLPVDFAHMFVAWLVARLAIRR
ncbi:MAG: type II CAAX endopeptidase family protein [Sulfitobacter sp.]